MVMATGSNFSSSSSIASSISDDASKSAGAGGTIKFLCSYGGRILPRYPDGKLRYFGGETRVLAVDRSVSFSELLVKMGELCGWGVKVSLRCQIPTEDLDALVSITSDEDLANLIEEYDLANRERASPLKIRAFLFSTSSFPSSKSPSPPISAASSPPSSVKGKSPSMPTLGFGSGTPASSYRRNSPCHQHRHYHQPQQYHQSHSPNHNLCSCCLGHGAPAMSSSSSSYRYPSHVHLVHNGNHWQ